MFSLWRAIGHPGWPVTSSRVVGRCDSASGGYRLLGPGGCAAGYRYVLRNFSTLHLRTVRFLTPAVEGLTSADASAKARRQKAQKSLMQALQPTIDDYLKHQHAASEPEKDSVAGEQDLSVHKRRLQALKPAIDAFLKQQQEAGRIANDENVADQAMDEQQWREPLELPG